MAHTFCCVWVFLPDGLLLSFLLRMFDATPSETYFTYSYIYLAGCQNLENFLCVRVSEWMAPSRISSYVT